MFVIDVIPLAKGAPLGSLSYRVPGKVALGALVSVPLRKKTVPGIVVSCIPAREAKAALKSADFMVRAATITTQGNVPEAWVHAAHDIAQYHATSVASVLGSLALPVLPSTFSASTQSETKYKEEYLEETYANRVEAYARLASTGSTLIVGPAIIEVERLAGFLRERGHTVHILTGTVSGKKREKLLTEAIQGSIVLTTPTFSWIPMRRIKQIIVERPSAGAYILPKRPYIDVRVALTKLAEHQKVSILFGDLPLPLEHRPKKSLPVLVTPVTIIDARTKDEEKKAFAAVPPELLASIKKALDRGERAMVLTVRKGYAPAVICRDCGNAVTDERGIAFALVSVQGKPILRSADGKVVRDADALCAHCGSWNLMGLGIGVERVAEELKAAFPKHDIIRFDADELKTSTATKAALKRFGQPGSIAVGTEAMIPLIDPREPIAVAGVASADSLLALPFWRARERLFRIRYQLQERAKHVYIATRLPDETIFTDTDAFLTEEIQMREALHYPPFGHLLVFHAEGTKARIEEAAALISSAFAPHIVVRLPDRLLPRGRTRLSMVSKVGSNAWPNEVIGVRIAALPPWIETHIDGESFW